jgi:NDP-sugar pyrophosphorylase family protein
VANPDAMAKQSTNSANLRVADTPVLILAGGLGTRLQSSFSGPKALAPVHGRPFLLHVLERLRAAGFSQAVLCTGYKASEIENFASSVDLPGLKLFCSAEDHPLGTAGALRLAAARYAAGRRVFAMNGDSILELDYARMLDSHLQRGMAATVALAYVPDTSRYGRIELDDQNRILKFREKADASGPGYINGGTYILQPDVIASIPIGKFVSLEREIFPGLCKIGIGGFRTSGYFIDIGIPEDLARAQVEFTQTGSK